MVIWENSNSHFPIPPSAFSIYAPNPLYQLEFYAHFPVDTPLFARLFGGFPFLGFFLRIFLTHCECRLTGGNGEIGVTQWVGEIRGSLSPFGPTLPERF